MARSDPLRSARQSPLHQIHRQLGARFTVFAGWQMPLQYSGVLEEVAAVREAAGLFDLSHLGEITVQGPRAEAFLQKMLTRDISRLAVGRATYSPMCNERGGIVDDLLVYRRPDGYMLVTNASTTQKVLTWLRRYAPSGTQVHNSSAALALIAVQGPASEPILSPLRDAKVVDLKHQSWVEGEVARVPSLVARTGYTGEDGFELFVSTNRAADMWNALMRSGASRGLKPCGLAARDILRLEAGFVLYGEDIDETTTPYEAGLGRFVDLSKEFIGREALQRQLCQGITRQLVGLEMIEPAVPRRDCPVAFESRQVGIVTSGVYSPTMGKGIALAYVSSELATPGTQVEVLIRGQGRTAQIVKTPFVRSSSARH